MGLTIQQKADTLGTWRHVWVQLMEMLAAWVPTSPELDVKTLFGQHIWQLAQHANAIGFRTVELRAKLHYDRLPQAAYADALQTITAAVRSGDRVAGFYDAILPDLASRLRQYAATGDELLDEPTLAIVRRILMDVDSMRQARQALAVERPDVVADPEWLARMREQLARCADIVSYREEVA